MKQLCLCTQITELLTDVERLKQALNGLSQLAYAGTAPSKRQTQHIDTLQAQVKSLQQQLAVSTERERGVRESVCARNKVCVRMYVQECVRKCV